MLEVCGNSPSQNGFVGISGFVVLLGLIWEGGRLRRSDKAAPEERWKELAWLGILVIKVHSAASDAVLRHGFVRIGRWLARGKIAGGPLPRGQTYAVERAIS